MAGANWLFMIALVVGFFHGWLKYRYRGTLTTFAFDMPLTLALGLALLKQGSLAPWFPRDDEVTARLKVLCVVAVGYALLPLGVPLLAALASFRGWVVIPLIFLLGYHVTRSIRQIETILLLILALCAVTAVYGARQSPEEIRQMLANDPELMARLSGVFFSTEGGSGVRAFSTFVAPAAFGSTLSMGGTFAFAFLTQPGIKPWKRAAFAAVFGLCAYGVQLSGARTALAMLGAGALLTAWSRQKLMSQAIAPGLAILVVGSMGLLVNPMMAERFATLLDPAQILGRLWIVVSPSTDLLLNYPLGGGLGRSGHGVPWIFRTILPFWEMRTTDGDLGRIIADFGIPGLIVFGALFYTGAAKSFRWMVKFRGTPLQTMSICSGAIFSLAVFNVVTGSPFLGVPGGSIIWFMLGAMSRLAKLHGELQAQAPGAVWSDPRLVPFGATAPSVEPDPLATTDGMPLPAAPRPHRRFLYATASQSGPLPAAVARPRPQGSTRVRRLFGNQPD